MSKRQKNSSLESNKEHIFCFIASISLVSQKNRLKELANEVQHTTHWFPFFPPLETSSSSNTTIHSAQTHTHTFSSTPSLQTEVCMHIQHVIRIHCISSFTFQKHILPYLKEDSKTYHFSHDSLGHFQSRCCHKFTF